MAQRALHHGPGRYRALFTFRGDQAAVRGAAQQLLQYAQRELAGRPLYVLVAIGKSALTEADASKLGELSAEALALSSALDLLVQVAADGSDDLSFGLRLVRFVVSQAQLKDADALSGVRRVLERENFGLRDSDAFDKNKFKLGNADEGDPRWLLFQRCPQDLPQFERLAPGQAALQEQAQHKNQMYRAELNSETLLLRRSFHYEELRESGLAFLASATSAQALVGVLKQFQADSDAVAKSSQTPGQSAGLFVVPSNAAWFGPALDLAPLPTWVTKFRREVPIVQYDVTQKMYDLLYRTFHAHSDKIRLDPAQPRHDLQLMVRGIIKLLLGYEISAGSLQEEFLDRVSGPQAEAKSGASASASGKVASLLPASAPQPSAVFGRSTGNDIHNEISVSASRHPIVDGTLKELSDLALEVERESYAAAQEAGRALGKAFEYITFSL